MIARRGTREPREVRRDLRPEPSPRPDPSQRRLERCVRSWDEPPQDPLTIAAAAEWMGVGVRYMATQASTGLIGSWPADDGVARGLIGAEAWRGHRWVLDREEIAARSMSGERARAASAPVGASPGLRYFLAVAPVVVHPPGRCPGRCAVHSPSSHPLVAAPLMWQRSPDVAVLRRCRHEVRHPDPDGIPAQVQVGGGQHSAPCCGCCVQPVG